MPLILFFFVFLLGFLLMGFGSTMVCFTSFTAALSVGLNISHSLPFIVLYYCEKWFICCGSRFLGAASDGAKAIGFGKC